MAADSRIKKNMAFNTAGSAVYFACQWLMIVIIVHIADYSKAGLLSLATSVTASPYIIALYGMRNYQVSDLDGKYTEGVYFCSRIVSSILSMTICLFMILLGGYGYYKSLVIAIYMCFKIVEAFADYYYALEQKADRMDYSGISLTVRGVGTLIVFVVSYCFMNDLFISFVLMTFFSLIVLVIYDIPIIRRFYSDIRYRGRPDMVKELMVECFPLAFVSYMNNLSVMIPRIMLEHYHGEEIMGYYSSVASPTSVIQLLATNLFAPLIVILTKRYNEKNKTEFTKIIKQFFAVSTVVTLAGIAAAYFLGEWILVLLFKSEIRPYVYLFVPVIIMTVLMALNSCLFGICTLMRVVKEQYVRGLIGVISSLAASVYFVRVYGAIGVVYASLVAIMLQMLLQLSVIARKLKNM